MDASTLPEINVGVGERVTSTAYFLSVVLVFLFCLAFMWGVFVRPTWNAQTDQDKRKWKTFWNHIEIIWLISAFSTIIFALSPGWSRLAPTLPIPALAEKDIVQEQNVIVDTGRGFLEHRCDPDKWPMLMEVCRLIQQAVDNKDISSKTMRQLAEELVTVINATKFPDSYTQGAAFNFANYLNLAHQDAEHIEYAKTFHPFYSGLADKFAFFVPYSLSIALSLRIAKAIAAYRL